MAKSKRFKKPKVGLYGRNADQKYIDEVREGDVLDFNGERLTVTYRSCEPTSSFVSGKNFVEHYLVDGVFADGAKFSDEIWSGDLFTVLEKP